MGGPRMDTLTEAARHGAAIRVVCQACGHERYFSPSALREWWGRGDPSPDVLRFRCRCGSRRVKCWPQRGVPRYAYSKLPPRPRKPDDDDVVFGR